MYRNNASKRLHRIQRSGALLLTNFAKTGKIRRNRPLSKRKCENAPATQLTPPPIIFWGKHPGAELVSHLSVGDGAFSKAGKWVL